MLVGLEAPLTIDFYGQKQTSHFPVLNLLSYHKSAINGYKSHEIHVWPAKKSNFPRVFHTPDLLLGGVQPLK